jgi:hypothetical protein
MPTVRTVVAWGIAIAAIAPIALAGCKGSPPNDAPAGESPQAKAEPTPLENVPPTASAQPLALGEAGPPPVPLRSDEAIAPDTFAKDTAGWRLEATLRTSDLPPAFRGPETSIVAIDAVKKKTDPHLVIDLASSRMRIVFDSAGFLLPQGSELRARADRYGHLLLLPDARDYRVAAPGSLRPLLGERRIDVEPLVTPSLIDRGEGARRAGYRTRKVELGNRVATTTLELARLADVGDGGDLLCRTVLDLMNAPPTTAVCALDEVPLHVEWRWATKGVLVFDVSNLTHRTDLVAGSLAAPPASAAFAPPALPGDQAAILVDSADLTAFRTAPADVPAGRPDGAPPPPAAGLALSNATDEIRVAWLDGAEVAWVAPGGRLVLPTLLRGRYGFAWRTFLGDAYDAPTTITVPGSQMARAAEGSVP